MRCQLVRGNNSVGPEDTYPVDFNPETNEICPVNKPVSEVIARFNGQIVTIYPEGSARAQCSGNFQVVDGKMFLSGVIPLIRV